MNNTRMTNDELVKLLFDYKELVQIMIGRANFNQSDESMLYYLVNVDDIKKAIVVANK